MKKPLGDDFLPWLGELVRFLEDMDLPLEIVGQCLIAIYGPYPDDLDFVMAIAGSYCRAEYQKGLTPNQAIDNLIDFLKGEGYFDSDPDGEIWTHGEYWKLGNGLQAIRDDLRDLEKGLERPVLSKGPKVLEALSLTRGFVSGVSAGEESKARAMGLIEEAHFAILGELDDLIHSNHDQFSALREEISGLLRDSISQALEKIKTARADMEARLEEKEKAILGDRENRVPGDIDQLRDRIVTILKEDQ